MEVNDGFLVTSLPAELITTTELKLKNSYQWLPLQTYVSISKHFMVKAKGVRFHGTVNNCNSVMQQLFYHVSLVLHFGLDCSLVNGFDKPLVLWKARIYLAVLMEDEAYTEIFLLQ